MITIPFPIYLLYIFLFHTASLFKVENIAKNLLCSWGTSIILKYENHASVFEIQV